MTEINEISLKRSLHDDTPNKKICNDPEKNGECSSQLSGVMKEINCLKNCSIPSIDNTKICCTEDKNDSFATPCIAKQGMDSDKDKVLENISTNAENEELFNGVEISKLSKRQRKKYMKVLKWQEVKKEKRAKERLRMKKKREYAKLNNIDLGPTRKELKHLKMADSPCKISVCLDLSFDDLMSEKDMGKTIKQILRVYTENRRAKEPMQLHLTNFNGKNKKEMSKHHGYENWDLNFHSENYLEVFPKDKLVYLSSESDNVINKLDADKVYIIGGLVDHNFHKGVCYKKAVEQGISHGQLPISEYFWMKHRKVFTINQVFEILLRVSEGKSFKEAFEMTLPKRINMQPSSTGDSEEDEEVEVPVETSS